jgi:hypothetical protein
VGVDDDGVQCKPEVGVDESRYLPVGGWGSMMAIDALCVVYPHSPVCDGEQQSLSWREEEWICVCLPGQVQAPGNVILVDECHGSTVV